MNEGEGGSEGASKGGWSDITSLCQMCWKLLTSKYQKGREGKQRRRVCLIPPSLLSLLQLRGFPSFFSSSSHSSSWPRLRSLRPGW